MGKKNYAVMDGSKVISSTGELLAPIVLPTGAAFKRTEYPNLTVVTYATMSVPAGVSFSIEAVFAQDTGYFGLSSSNLAFRGELQVGSSRQPVLVDGVAVPGSNKGAGSTRHIDYNGITGEVRILDGATVKATVVVASLVGKAVYVYGNFPNGANGDGGLNVGNTPFTTLMIEGGETQQAGLYTITEPSNAGEGVLNSSLDFEANFGSTYSHASETGVATTNFDIASASVYDIEGTSYGFIPKTQGFNLGRASEDVSQKTRLELTPKGYRFNALSAKSSLKVKTVGFERNETAPYTPREFWGDN